MIGEVAKRIILTIRHNNAFEMKNKYLFISCLKIIKNCLVNLLNNYKNEAIHFLIILGLLSTQLKKIDTFKSYFFLS